MIERDWYNLYGDNWNGEIVPDAYAHPAKFARGLIRRIYEHCLEMGYMKPGDVVLDPFGGVALGARDAITGGLYWIGVELEQNFVDLGQGCECTGIGKADWVRFFGRWDRARYLEGRHWCPTCLSQAKEISQGDNQLSFFDRQQSATYIRNSGRIPHTRPHHYTGNVEKWNTGRARLIQGDSRQLCRVVEAAGACVSSPPYAKTNPDANSKSIDIEKQWQTYRSQGGGMSLEGFRRLQEKHSQGYGTNPANLGNLPAGTPPDVVVSSPPYASSMDHAPGNKGWVEEPTETQAKHGNRGYSGQVQKTTDYGQTPGQLGAMRVVSSPPYAESVNQSDGANDAGARIDRKRGAGIDVTHKPNVGGPNSVLNQPQVYGDSAGQLGRMKVVSSPPYEGSMSNEANGIDWEKCKPDYPGRQFHSKRIQMLDRNHSERRYGSGIDNIGNQQGTDFWTAARAIMEQVAMLLPPGAVAVWVTKRFVKNKEVVDFSRQWAALGEDCGFETIEWIRAWLIEDRGKQYDLFGGLQEKQVKRSSFFRRLYESKYPENAIDWEDVVIQRRLPDV